MSTRIPTFEELAAYPPQRSKTLNATLVRVDRKTCAFMERPFRIAVDGHLAKAAAELLAEWWRPEDAARPWLVPGLFDRPNVEVVVLPCAGLDFQSFFVVHPVAWSDDQVLERLARAVNSFDPTAISN
ncbi:hypothetical protein [Antrihabitans stalactiti]|uniref:Uncharacterized protein n=1 Tax=Antrihabitans stalactiti TaxID=2584121 RepID=A0A848K739_9NOCA|nr:hypothetical protein [Antrihabitans stalactiti]NMN94825.1 hypothetical protein [Antrihabitans stalactiti]